MRRWVCFFCCLALLCLSTSCRTKVTEIEYVPVEVKQDIRALAQPLLDLKPQPVVLIEDVQTLSDVMRNSVAFQQSYNEWRTYALSLEDFITGFNTDD